MPFPMLAAPAGTRHDASNSCVPSTGNSVEDSAVITPWLALLTGLMNLSSSAHPAPAIDPKAPLIVAFTGATPVDSGLVILPSGEVLRRAGAFTGGSRSAGSSNTSGSSGASGSSGSSGSSGGGQSGGTSGSSGSSSGSSGSSLTPGSASCGSSGNSGSSGASGSAGSSGSSGYGASGGTSGSSGSSSGSGGSQSGASSGYDNTGGSSGSSGSSGASGSTGSSGSSGNGSGGTSGSSGSSSGSESSSGASAHNGCGCVGPVATVVDLGGGCGAPSAPVLTCGPLALGTTPIFRVTSDQVPFSPLYVFMSMGSPTPVALPGTDCVLHVDVLNLSNLFLVLVTTTDENGNFELPLPVGEDPAAIGLTFTLQARVWAVGGPIAEGDHPSNACRITVGCPEPTSGGGAGGSGSSGTSGSSGASGSSGSSGSSGAGSGGTSGSSGSSSGAGSSSGY